MSKISALIKLLEDPDEQIFLQVRKEILSVGFPAVSDLEDALIASSDEDFTERVQEILAEIQSEYLSRNFEQWAKSEEQDLLDLMVLVEQIRDLNFSKQDLIEPIVQLKMDIWLELNESQTILEQVRIIDQIIYTKHDFSVYEEDPYDVCNYFINNLLSTKKGNDTTLGVLYLYLAQSQKISFHGVKLLPNFLLAYTDSPENKGAGDVLFYLNPYKIQLSPYKHAAKFSFQNLQEFFAEAGVALHVDEITPCSNIDIARRWLWFIQQAYFRKGDEKRLILIHQLLRVLAL